MFILDLIIFFLILFSGINGYKKGFIYQFFIPSFLIISIYNGKNIFKFIKKILQKYFFLFKKDTDCLIFYSLIITFLCIILYSILVKKIINYFLNILYLQEFDKIMGALLNMIKYFIYISIYLFFIKMINEKFFIIPDNLLKNSFEKIFKFFFIKEKILLNKIMYLYSIYCDYFKK